MTTEELMEKMARAGYEQAVTNAIPNEGRDHHLWEHQSDELKEDWRKVAKVMFKVVCDDIAGVWS